MLNFFRDIKDPIFLLWIAQIRTVKSMNSHIADFKRYLMNNKFIGERVKKESIKCVDEILRIAYLSYKYGKMWLVNFIKRKASVNDFDLGLNEINENTKDVIVYVDVGARRKYLFSQKDFRKIIKTNLENSYVYDHLPQPMPIRNPYTNREFNKLDFIEIDTMLVDSPLIWKMYKNCRYNLEWFKLTNYNYLMICSVGSYVDQLEKADIVFYIQDIFMFYNYIHYCKECLRETTNLYNRKLRRIIMNWCLFQKRLGVFTQDDLNTICDMYKFRCKPHKIVYDIDSEIGYIRFDSNLINVQFTGGPIIEKFIFRGTLDIGEETTREKSTNKKIKKNRKVLKKRTVIKTIT